MIIKGNPILTKIAVLFCGYPPWNISRVIIISNDQKQTPRFAAFVDDIMNFLLHSPLILFFILFRLLLSLHALAFVYLWYWRLWWFDIIMHLMGGFLVASIYLYLFCYNKRFSKKKIVFLALLSALLIGAIWEIFEVGFDKYLAVQIDFKSVETLSLGWRNTLSDTFFNFLGGLVAAWWFLGLPFSVKNIKLIR